MSRGIRRSVIYTDEQDFNVFMMIVQNTIEKMPFHLHSFCMMTNHFHLLLTTKEVEVGIIMKNILGNYAKYFNKRYGYKGHLFEDRYVSGLIKSSEHLLEVSRYIHLNPVRAGITDKPDNFPYSSYKYYISEDDSPMVDKKIILDHFGENPLDEYKKYVEFNRDFAIELSEGHDI